MKISAKQETINMLSRADYFTLNSNVQKKIKEGCQKIINDLNFSLEAPGEYLSGYSTIAYVLPEESFEIVKCLEQKKLCEHYEKEAIEILQSIIYSVSDKVMEFIFNKLEEDTLAEGKSAFENLLVDFSEYTLRKFRALQCQPQKDFLNFIDRRYTDIKKIHDNSSVLNTLIGCFKKMLSLEFSPDVSRQSWNKVKLNMGSLLDDLDGDLTTVREKSITWLIKLFNLSDSVGIKCSVIRALNNALNYSRGAAAERQKELINTSAIMIFDFYIQYLQEDNLSFEIINEIDQYVRRFYLQYRESHAEDVKERLEKIKKLILLNSEYAYYCTLFFAFDLKLAWNDMAHHDYHLLLEENLQNSLIQNYIDTVQAGKSLKIWFKRLWSYRILNFNDMADGIILIKFLKLLGQEKPRIAWGLFEKLWDNFEFNDHVLTNKSAHYIKHNCICLLAGILKSQDLRIIKKVEKLLLGWTSHGYHLALSIEVLCMALQENVEIKHIIKFFDTISRYVIRKQELDSLNATMRLIVDSKNENFRSYSIVVLQALNKFPLKERTNWIYRLRPLELQHFSATVSQEELLEIFASLKIINNFTSHIDWLLAGEAGQGIVTKYPKELIQFLYEKYNYSVREWLNNTCSCLAQLDVSEIFNILYDLFIKVPKQENNLFHCNSIKLIADIYKRVLVLEKADTNDQARQQLSTQMKHYIDEGGKKVKFVIGILSHAEDPEMFSEIYIKIFSMLEDKGMIQEALRSLSCGIKCFSGFDGLAKHYYKLSELCKRWGSQEGISLDAKKELDEWSEKLQVYAEKESSRSKKDIAALKAQYGESVE